ncbi:hypothetical protein DICVIV_14500 [Dictyocaulus viviparus]|uniref:Uncharacterized protein n=1 Tax=Dictyocaulus viviparus TaxID=29172 RepID=A0A0D8XAS7_DICVI|nr:hypothetical protein DICVIV_14500 [Dictyocaulus viviparus]
MSVAIYWKQVLLLQLLSTLEKEPMDRCEYYLENEGFLLDVTEILQ